VYGWTTTGRGSISDWREDTSLLHRVHATSYRMGIMSKVNEGKAEQSPTSRAEVWMYGAVPPFPYIFMARCLI